ncbi:hypothetical protein T439DRAFT_325025 [Meredithblackwellia eburnea MCA 4105]
MTIPIEGFDPSQEWTIPLLLEEAKRLQAILPPVFSWPQLRDLINRCELKTLRRHEILEDLYFNHFNPFVRSQFGTTEEYLRQQLGWDVKEGELERIKAKQRGEKEYWTRSSVTRVRPNDWAYSIPKDIKHWVAWTPLPILHEGRCEGTSISWEQASSRGLTGFSGDDKSLPGFGAGPQGPGSDIEAFVKERWSENEWETAWFVNPPSLQSVRGLAHFHVLARPKSAEAHSPVL